ncbi:DHA2 family efflux MFS transporter permease subunit [Sanguibacter suaedae]|uniref:DHA2 family efflux MFS transporter permease subunit n=1 Tax=Sanguibacter suaedae TaxID=2795737 RepID=A0A934IBK7_9MICO|nr:DHA2 family efflux MFS transporter permease subunit [Sanguibacter suaedae]MBI9115685.1 DHA2 family efflux MFS transporter permease subunit [Sanguibacter suaedae]
MNTTVARPWAALWALVVGFFMILVDTTIVSVANPSIMRGLGTDINAVIWVTSAYLLAYAAPLLVTGRLGDRYGPKPVYLVGLTVFTLASAACGLSSSVEALVGARVVQGLGAAMMTPQTMAVITRVFPPDGRGKAMGLWGAVAGVATLVGPLLGGVLVDGLGWEWIFFVNVPVGVVAFVLAWRLVPTLPTSARRIDGVGVALSAVGMVLLVFGIQEGQTYDWGSIEGVVPVWAVIVSGAVVLTVFVVHQARTRAEPLLPLGLFHDRNFSLANGAITAVGFTVTSLSLPLVFYYQLVLGFSPTRSALMLVPMAVLSMVLAPVVGKLVDRVNPRDIAVTGLVLMATSLVWYSVWLVPDESQWWRLLLPSAVLGVANACTWSPVSSTATRNLPPAQAGAGSGVFNTTRQVGSVLGSAAVAALIQARLAAELGAGTSVDDAQGGGQLPAALHDGFAAAMSQALLLPAAVAVVGAVTVAFFARPDRTAHVVAVPARKSDEAHHAR